MNEYIDPILKALQGLVLLAIGLASLYVKAWAEAQIKQMLARKLVAAAEQTMPEATGEQKKAAVQAMAPRLSDETIEAAVYTVKGGGADGTA